MLNSRIITDPGQAQEGPGLGSSGLRPRLGNDPPTTRFTRGVRRTTGWFMRLLERIIGARLKLDGIDQLGEGPVLFVANHFTRFETFILPYLIWLHSGRMVRSLAWHGLFSGLFGRYLLIMGARPTRDPGIRHRMVEDLMTGRHDWMIYPEGSMVKDKRLWKDGRYELSVPDRHGPPHTGAAVMALKALAYRAMYLRAVREGRTDLQHAWEGRYHLEGPLAVSRVPLRIVPLSITYWPLRPEPNLLSRLAGRLVGSLPEVVREELTVEGSLLLNRTDMSVHVGRPISIARYTDLILPGASGPDFGAELKRVAASLSGLKHRLTRRMMHEVYRGIEVTIDHLFCAALRHLRRDTIPVADLHRALWLTARQLQNCGEIRTHGSLGAGLSAILAGTPYPPLAGIVALAVEEGMLTVDGDTYRINRVALASDPGFHGIRLRNTVAVIANEVEPVRPAIRLLAQLVNQPTRVLARRSVRMLLREMGGQALAERRRYPPALSVDVCMPRLLVSANARLAVVLVHGYLASPGEVAELADHLRSRGHSVVLVRLAGHGSAPQNLATTGRQDWQRSVEQGIAVARCISRHVAVVGFSTGGLLALQAAGAMGEGVVAAVALNPSLRLRDPRVHLARLVDRWNGVVPAAWRLALVGNTPAWPDTNYAANPIHALAELMRLIAALRRSPPRLRCPTLLIQADRDDVVDPRGIDQLARLLGGEVRLDRIASDRHVCLRGPGAEIVWRRVGEFLDEVAGHIEPGQSDRRRPNERFG